MARKKITKVDLVDAVYVDTNHEKKMIQEVIDTLLQKVKKSLSDGSSIELRGFGTFELRLRKGRKRARNPRTGEAVTVESHAVAAFRPGKELKKAVWPLANQLKGAKKR